ncbi:FAD:protein FMN transferase [Kribbella sp. NPDC003557]|uniref:FAD:protein FMN transferase n=1 Tax=Kribbella sp. NPDC003557 TaxID=3154449 RepID=UPI0033A9E882
MAPRRSWVEQIMGLPVSVLARGEAADSEQAEVAVRDVFAELSGVDRVFSPYRTDSAVSRLARGEVGWDQVDPLVREVAERCAAARELTGGLFDAQVPGGGWDPSGLVKGWAVERAGERLREVADVDWCLNAGGDVLVVCPSGEPFTVGIQDPRDPGRVIAGVPRTGGAVATSGTAARGAHLYDPRTGGPAGTRWLSVSVTGPSLEYADVLATAAFVAGDDWPAVLLPGYEGLGVLADGNLSATACWGRA